MSVRHSEKYVPRKIRAKKVLAAEQEAKALKRAEEKAAVEAAGGTWIEPKRGRPPVDDTITEWVDRTKEVLEVLEHVHDINITHPDFYKGRVKTADKFIAVTAYLVYGNSRLASKYMGNRVKAGTIRQWKHSAPWWSEVENAIRNSQGWRWDYKATRIIDKGSDEILDRLENGDEVLDKNGVRVRKKVPARDVAMILGQVFDKRALSRGDPTSRSESKTAENRLKELEQKFREFGGAAKLIEGEIVNE